MGAIFSALSGGVDLSRMLAFPRFIGLARFLLSGPAVEVPTKRGEMDNKPTPYCCAYMRLVRRMRSLR